MAHREKKLVPVGKRSKLQRLSIVVEQIASIIQSEQCQIVLSYFSVLIQIGSHLAFLFFAFSVPKCCNSFVLRQYILQRALPSIGIALSVILLIWTYCRSYFDQLLLQEVAPEPIVPNSMSSTAKAMNTLQQQRAEGLSIWRQRKMLIEIVHDVFFAAVITYFFLQFGPGASLVGCILASARCTVLLAKLLYDAIYGSDADSISIPVLLYIFHSLCIVGVWIAALISLVSELGLYTTSTCYDEMEGGWFSDNSLCGMQYCGAVNNVSTTISSVPIGGELYSYCSFNPSSYKVALRSDNSKGICCHWDRP
jgi:hypothetical protein